MAGRVTVLTDSTAGVPESAGVIVVPLRVQLGDRSGLEGHDVAPQDVSAALAAHERVLTSQPAPAAFTQGYARALAVGVQGVLAVHLSGKLSGTVAASQLAARELAVPVEVLDSRSIGMGVGFPVLAALRAARAGAPLRVVAAAARAQVPRTRVLLAAETLEHLRRGGRLSGARAAVGTVLAVRPILHVTPDGGLAPLERVRTFAKALTRLADLAVAEAGPGAVDVAVHHVAARERADQLLATLVDRLPRVADSSVSELGAAVAAHVGPGAVAVVVHHRRVD